METCYHCGDETEEHNDDGKTVCGDCALDHCNNCLLGDCEVETSSGDYVCADCYSGMIDSAMDCYGDE